MDVQATNRQAKVGSCFLAHLHNGKVKKRKINSPLDYKSNRIQYKKNARNEVSLSI